MPDFLTVKEFAEAVGVTILTVKRWLYSGQIEGKKFGRLWRIDKSELDKVLPEKKNPE